MEKHVGADQQIRSFKELQRAINEVIGHFWEDEVEDFANNYDENEIMDNHIFCCLVALDNFVHENNRTPVQAAKDSGYFQEVKSVNPERMSRYCVGWRIRMDGFLKKAMLEVEDQAFDFFLPLPQMTAQCLLEEAKHILRTEWHLSRHINREEFREEWEEDLVTHKKRFAEMYKTACGKHLNFEEAWELIRKNHNECARQNIDGNMYDYIVPEFQNDGSHGPVGPKDGPQKPEFK